MTRSLNVVELANIGDVYEKSKGCALSIGFFDGVHIGHQRVISTLVDEARPRGLTSVVFTFDIRPKSVLRDGGEMKLLSPFHKKCELILSLGVDVVTYVSFTREFSRMEGLTFCQKVLDEKLNPSVIVVGEDFRFGSGAGGDVNFLSAYYGKRGVEVKIVELLKLNGEKVSSSAIRELVEAGDFDRVREFLGRDFVLEGKVVPGSKRGRELGFPTLNLKVDKSFVTPGDGVYAAYLYFGEQTYECLVNIGCRPTFEGKKRSIEAHVLGFNLDLYGETVRIGFLKRLRDEMKFASKHELVEQIRRDIEASRSLFSLYSKSAILARR